MVSIPEAESLLAESVREGREGVDKASRRNARPVAEAIPGSSARLVRVPGAWAGQIDHNEDVVGVDDEIVALFDVSVNSELP